MFSVCASAGRILGKKKYQESQASLCFWQVLPLLLLLLLFKDYFIASKQETQGTGVLTLQRHGNAYLS